MYGAAFDRGMDRSAHATGAAGARFLSVWRGRTRGSCSRELGGSQGRPAADSFSVRGVSWPPWTGNARGGLRVPPLTPLALRQAREGVSAGGARPGYTDEGLANAITQGIDASHHALHPSMPRYQLTSDQLAGVIAYLNRIGGESDTDLGVTATAVTVGAALPLTGPLAQIGQDVAAILRGAIQRLNEQGVCTAGTSS